MEKRSKRDLYNIIATLPPGMWIQDKFVEVLEFGDDVLACDIGYVLLKEGVEVEKLNVVVGNDFSPNDYIAEHFDITRSEVYEIEELNDYAWNFDTHIDSIYSYLIEGLSLEECKEIANPDLWNSDNPEDDEDEYDGGDEYDDEGSYWD